MATLTFKRSVFSLSSLRSNRCFSSVAMTKHYRNLTNGDKQLVEQLIDNAPGSNMGMTSIMTGKGLTDPAMKERHTRVQKALMSTLARQFDSNWNRIRFFGIYLKNMTSNLKRMNELKKVLNPTIKGDALKYNLIDHSFQGVVMSKTLVQMYGQERAAEMLANAQNVCGPLFNEATIAYLESDVPHHLRYAVVNGINKKVLSKSAESEGTFDIDWIDGDIYSKEFEFHVKRCVFSDVGKAFGDTEANAEDNLTYRWFCQFDDKMLPSLGEHAEFEFKRTGTLGKGCTHCDFRFEHSPSTSE
eukprot:1031175_1